MNKTKGFILTFIAMASAVVFIGFSLIAYMGYDIFYGSYDHLEKTRIVDILSKESTVYYSDGVTQVGSLFGTEHRQYVPFTEMPKELLNAVVAAEDDEFFNHFGVNFTATLRAVFRNVFMGRREGASTITQQTVKNLYGRPKTNLRAKFVEAINSFKIERKYSKDEILEFYLNQFHVTGNGRGAGIASKYYFDKDSSQLSLVEAAFIAGSVKAPERYNPFTKRSPEAQLKARQEAKHRKDYVLRRMYKVGFIEKDVLETAQKEEVPFKQGKFQFNELFITELVQRQMSRKEVLAALGVDDVNALGTMGLRITTTLERPVQIQSQYGVRQNLSRLEMILSGFKKEPETNFTSIQRPEKYGFYTAKVLELSKEENSESVKLSLGVPECNVPTDGIVRVSNILDQAYSKGLKRSRKEFMAQLSVGDFVLSSIRDVAENGDLICDIERRPKIQGGLIALDKGNVIAMVGGYSPYEYNRAVFAQRQPGSTFKSITFYAAMQLGWSALDSLSNVRNVFSWQGQFYFPRADHPPRNTDTTLVGAGATSENLASVYLLAHLTDRLSFSQFKELLTFLNLYRPDEDENKWFRELSNKYNVRMHDSHLRAGIFNAIRSDFLTDFSVTRNKNVAVTLKNMNYGIGFDGEMSRLNNPRNPLPSNEKIRRREILKNNFLRWGRLYEETERAVQAIQIGIDGGNLNTPEVRVALSKFRLSEDRQKLYYISANQYLPAAAPYVQRGVEEANVPNPAMRNFNLSEIMYAVADNRLLINEENILLDGLFPMTLYKELSREINNRFVGLQDASTLEKLYWHDDFRYSLGMVYSQHLVKQMGIESKIQPVPSFPLGTNVVTLAELALSYQTLLNGETYRYFDTQQENQIMLVKRVEDFNGQLIWEGDLKSHQLVDRFYSLPILSIMRSVVTRGTGSLANQKVILRSSDAEVDKKLLSANIRIPTFGKTGTTNDYTNASYVGLLPYPDVKGSSLSMNNGFSIASYVGYDTNQPMRKRGIRITGGAGALPAWIEAAQALIKERNFADKLGWERLVENKVREVQFDYGNANHISATLDHGVLGGDDSNDDEETLDANKFINEYERKNTRPASLALQGSVVDGIFQPVRKVSFFDLRALEEVAPTAEGLTSASSNAGSTEVDAGSKYSSNIPPAPPMDALPTLAPESLDDIRRDEQEDSIPREQPLENVDGSSEN